MDVSRLHNSCKENNKTIIVMDPKVALLDMGSTHGRSRYEEFNVHVARGDLAWAPTTCRWEVLHTR